MPINLGDIDRKNRNQKKVGTLNLSRKNVEEKEEKQTWFDSGAFDDGYQFGDITKTVLGTAGDIATNLGKGVVSAGESIGDLAAYAGAQVVDWLGNEDYANVVRERAAESLTDKIFAPVDKVVDNNSVLGEKTDNVVNSIGNMYAQGVTSSKLLGSKGNIPINIAGKKFNLPVTSLISGASSGMSNAVNKGAEDWQMWTSGAVSGLAEGIGESIFGTFGIGGSALDDYLVESATKKMTSSLAKSLTKAGIKAVGEGSEEIVSYLLNYAGDHAIDYVKNTIGLSGPSIANEFNKEEMWDNFWGGVLAAGVGGIPSVISEYRGNTPNINVNEGVNQFRQNTGANNRYSLPIYNQNIENTTVNDAVNSRVNQNMLQNNVSAPVMNSEGNIVNPNRYVYIKSDNTNIDTLRKSASQYFNNSSETRNFLNTIEKIIRDKDYSVVFDDSIVNSKGNPVNAQISTDNGRVTIKINPNSDRAGEFLIVHEVTHGIETSDMKQLVLDFASKNPEFNTALESLKQTYGTNDVNSEVLADISGQLLGNQEFINSLTMQNTQQSKNIIRKIYESIRRLLNTLTENGRYKNFVQDLEAKWRDAYKTTTTEQAINNISSNTQYHISQNASVGIDNVLNNINERNPVRLRDYTPDILVQNGIKDLPMYENPSHIRKNILTVKEAQSLGLSVMPGDHYHGLGKELFLRVIDSLDNPRVIFKNKNNNDFLILTVLKDNQGDNIVVPIEVETTTYANNMNIDTNRIKSIYGYNNNRKSLNEYIKHNMNNNIFEKIYEQKKKSSTSNISQSTSVANNIPQSTQNVNSSTSTRYSMQENKNNAVDSQGRELSKEQQDFFKNSKVRDENGNLLTMYHGSVEDFYVFDKSKIRVQDYDAYFNGFWFSNSPTTIPAMRNAKYRKEVYLNITNPAPAEVWRKVVNEVNEDNILRDISRSYDDEVRYRLQDMGYDGVLWNKSYNITQKNIDEFNTLGKTTFSDVRGRLYDFIKEDENTSRLYYHNKLNNEIVSYNNLQDLIDDSNSQEIVYVAFEPNQIKTVDNTTPTFNEDIRLSQTNQTWQEYLEENYPARGTRTNMQDIRVPTSQDIQRVESSNISLPNPNRVLNPLEISQLTPEDANTTPILPNVNRNRINDGDSRFASNIRNKTNMLNEQQKNTILADEEVNYYDTITNEDSLNEAFSRLNENGETETLNWFSRDSESATAVDVAEGWILLKQYADNNDSDGMVAVAKKLRDMGTKAGQTVQAFNIMARMTPEGMVKYAQSELSEAYDRMVKNKTKKWIDQHQKDFDLTPQETAAIMDIMQKVSTMPDGYEKRVELAKIQKIMTDKLPPERGAGIKSWMRISMLFNPKTQIRNVAGNAIIAPVNSFSDLFASMADKVIGSKTGYRTTGVTNIQNYVKGMKEGLYQSYNDFKQGINTRNIQGNRFEISEGKSFNNNTAIGKSLNRVDSLLSFMLDAGDRMFYEASFTNSINNQLVLNNTTEVTQEMIDIATQEALSRTWQDNNNYTRFVLNVRKMLNNVNIRGYGLGDVLIPFAKTPANLTKAIVDYSPVGLVNTLVKGKRLKNAIETNQFTPQMQHDFVQTLGKATVGTMLYIAGYALAKAGIVSGESDDDKDVQNFMKNTLGVNSYSIKIGDKSFTYDWAQPIAAPLSIMANIVQKEDENASTLETVLSSLDTAGNILLEQSFMESINTALNNTSGLATGVQEAIFDLPARAIPTFMKQIADMVDGTQRTSFEYGKPLESAINSVKSKIPFLSKTLAPSVDSMGREIQKYGGNNNIFNVFFNPANVSTENISESAGEIYRLYQETGDTTIMPRVAPYYINKDGEKITLDSSQRATYQKTSGSIIEEEIQRLLDNSEYKKLTDEDKASVIGDIVNYSYNIAQKEVLGTEISQTYQKAYEYSQIGDVSDYYTFTNSIDDSSAETKRNSIIRFLIASNLSDKEIATLYGKYYSSEEKLNDIITLRIPIKEYIKLDSQEFTTDYKNGKAVTNSKKSKLINYVNSLNLSIPQKAYLIKSQYSSYDDYNGEIINYINNQNLTKYDKAVMLKNIGFDDYNEYIVNEINSRNISTKEKIEILEDLGFRIIDGRVYW